MNLVPNYIARFIEENKAFTLSPQNSLACDMGLDDFRDGCLFFHDGKHVYGPFYHANDGRLAINELQAHGEARVNVNTMVTLNVPHWFRRASFIAWMLPRIGDGLASWHTGGVPDEYSDVFIHVSHQTRSNAPLEGENGYTLECSECLPEGLGREISNILAEDIGAFSGIVRLTNLNP